MKKGKYLLPDFSEDGIPDELFINAYDLIFETFDKYTSSKNKSVLFLFSGNFISSLIFISYSPSKS